MGACPRVIRTVIALVMLVSVSSCQHRRGRVIEEPCAAGEGGDGQRRCYKTWEGARAITPKASCQVSLCFAGAMGHSPALRIPFQNICANEPIPGLMKDCEAEGCQPTFDSFTDSNRSIYRRLFAVLDTNDDMRIDETDEPCEVNFIGFSWGGVTANKLAHRLNEDERVARGYGRVTRMLLVDPYQPWARLEIPENVERVRVWRQSYSPPGDCSKNAPGGPYKGLRPECGEHEDCQDIDISRLPGGASVGHCRVAEFVRDSIMEEIHDRGGDAANMAADLAATEESLE